MRGKTESGQAVTEYMLLLLVILLIFIGVLRVLKGRDLAAGLTAPIRKDFARAYKYGHPQAQGFDEGTPQKHVRIEDSGNFRLYVNPR